MENIIYNKIISLPIILCILLFSNLDETKRAYYINKDY